MVYRIMPRPHGHCALCGLPSPTDLCFACEGELPRIAACCWHCGIPLGEHGLCGECLFAPPAFSRCICPLRYEPPVSHLLGSFKYQGNLHHGRILSQLLAAHLQRERDVAVDALVPVPLHWTRRWQRGFNQSELIADELGRALQLPLQPRWLPKPRSSSSQQHLDAEARRKNLRDAFTCSGAVSGMHLAVIDDVVTTGATANAIAQTLLAGGAASVQIWALARTP